MATPPHLLQVQGQVGSGVIIDPNGYIVTNHHVIADAKEIRVILNDRRAFSAKVVGSDMKSDLAVVKIDARNLPSASWGDSSKLQVGEYVLAIGNPFGLMETVTLGIISAVGRANVGIADYEDFIQTDAPINPGNSGGALVNIRGELIGVNTAIFSDGGGSMGIGFAIPSNMAKPVMESLMKAGKVVRGWLGISIQEVTSELAKEFGLSNPKGVLVGDLLINGPADKAGLRRGDIILEADGEPVESVGQFRNLTASASVGSPLKLNIYREGRPQTIGVTVEENVGEASLGSATASGAEGDERADGRHRGPRHLPGGVGRAYSEQ
ncbi:MAG: trypsin-like peptidase domain-containing protein [Candidatus Manganitrophus sp.]|nr:trypsin-like peptidase domain-containing protein [Candidatus Manganitrophus sp.]